MNHAVQQRFSPLQVSTNVLAPRLDNVVVYFGTVLSLIGVVLGLFIFFVNRFDVFAVWYLGFLTLTTAFSIAQAQVISGTVKREQVIVMMASIAAAVLIWTLPEYFFGFDVNAIVHRSLFSSLIVTTVAIVSLSSYLYLLLGARSTARDLTRVPFVLVPAVFIFVLYAMLLGKLFAGGFSGLNWEVVSRPYTIYNNGGQITYQSGMRNQVLGTLLLVGLTMGISLPIGVSAGVYINEYQGVTASAIRFCTTMLRAMSILILGITAFAVVDFVDDSPGTFLSDFINGVFPDPGGVATSGDGSFLFAAMVLSLLIIPVITRATEQGLISVPNEIREGSVALGASDAYSLRRLLVPWAVPDIITGTILGAAEAAGSLAIILLVAGSGEFGIGPLREVTSLSFFIFHADPNLGQPPFNTVNVDLRFSAGVLLMFITLTLTVLALVLKQRSVTRFRA